jgi:hypothetical protein
MLWENVYRKSYAMICDLFSSHTYLIIFHQEYPSLSKQEKKILSHIGNWYIEDKYTYIRIFGIIGSPRLLPTYVLDNIFLGEFIIKRFFMGLIIPSSKTRRGILSVMVSNFSITLLNILHRICKRG